MRVPPLFLACVVLLLGAAGVQAQPPTGAWKVNANGHEGELVIDSIKEGKVEGTLLGDKIRGFYDEKSKCLSLLRLGADGGTKQTYKGYLFHNKEQTKYNLAGTFQVFGGEGGAGVEYGWYAHVAVPKE
jgi:hypothetical protein